MKTQGCAILLAAAVALLGGCGGREAPDLSEPEPKGPVAGSLILVLDTSGSMSAPVHGEGRERFDVAQDVLLNDFVPLISDDLALALCVFEGDDPWPLTGLVRAGDVVKPGWRQKEWVMEQIELAHPSAATPIVDSLEWAQKKLRGRPAPRFVVLITDGEETERPRDVKRTVEALGKAGIELYAIGFNIGKGGKVLAQSLGPRYVEATGGRDSLLGALRGVLAAIER